MASEASMQGKKTIAYTTASETALRLTETGRMAFEAAVHACNKVIPRMAEAGGGANLFISSTSGPECVSVDGAQHREMR